MYKIVLSNIPDKTWVDESRQVINLYAVNDIVIRSKSIAFIDYSDFKYEFSKGIIAIPFCKKVAESRDKLYYPNSFMLKGSGRVKVAIDGRRSLNDKILKKGDYIATLRLMTSQFYELMRRGDGSDKGLRPAYINILFNE